MGGTIFDIEKFDGTSNYFLWKKKLKAIGMQLKVDVALEEKPKLHVTMTTFERSEMFKTAYSTIFLHLSYNVLRQVDRLETAAEIWKKLDELYLVKSLPNKIYLLERFFGFKMDTSKTIDQNLYNFNKTAIKYDRDSLTTSIVINAIKSKDFETHIKKDKSMSSRSGESYYYRGRSPYKRNKNCKKRIQDERNLSGPASVDPDRRKLNYLKPYLKSVKFRKFFF
ncbi:hypothetical protein UlMin_030294 [Ulmus minor]